MRPLKRTESEDKLPLMPLSRILFFIFLILIVYLLFYYNYFQIKKIVVIGANSVSDKEIENDIFSTITSRRFLIFPGKNIFLVNKAIISANLKQNFYRLERVDVSRIYPSVLKVKIVEIEPQAIWQTQGKNYFINSAGKIYASVSLTEIDESNLPKIQDEGNKEIALRDQVLFEKHLNFVKKLNDKLPKDGIKIKNFSFPARLADEIHVTTDEGWKIYMNVDKDADAQIDNLKLVLVEEIKDRRKGLDYIDLRVESKVYYKMK